MEFLRRAANPWGQDVFLGIGWDLIWLAAFVGAAFMVGHALWALWWRRRASNEETAPVSGSRFPARLLRHGLSARVFHWVMALAMFVLLITAFFPVLGLRFDWVTLHWAAGLVLTATIVYHMVHATFVQGLGTMTVGPRDVEEGRASLKQISDPTAPSPGKPGKYPVDQKLFHHAAAVVTIAAIVTGLLMMVRIDTPLWGQNPYLLSDQLWGVVYVVHGLSGVALITMTIAHVYFALRPEKLWMTRSMIRGWITREEYLTHHDPERWEPEPAGEPVVGTGTQVPAGAESA